MRLEIHLGEIHVHIHNSGDEVPSWVNDVMSKLDLVVSMERRDMSAIEDLNNSVTALAEGFTALDVVVQAEIVALTKAIADQNNDAVAQAASNISAISSSMAADAAALTASVPATTTVPPPPPPPEPTVPPVVEPPVITPPEVTDPSATPPEVTGRRRR